MRKPYCKQDRGCGKRAMAFYEGSKSDNVVILDPGEFVARWEECCRCQDGVICLSPGGCDAEGECVEAPIYEQCAYCNGTGRVAVPVEVEK